MITGQKLALLIVFGLIFTFCSNILGQSSSERSLSTSAYSSAQTTRGNAKDIGNSAGFHNVKAHFAVNSRHFACGFKDVNRICANEDYGDRSFYADADKEEKPELISKPASSERWADASKHLEHERKFFPPQPQVDAGELIEPFPTSQNIEVKAEPGTDVSHFRRLIVTENPFQGTDERPDADITAPPVDDKFKWGSAIKQSFMLLGIQHGYALVMQPRTRRALNGNFFRDYIDSVKAISGWDDGNKFFTNYIAHPMQGGLTGFIFVQNSPKASRQQFGKSKEYWNSRLKAFVWSAAWSTQFELGPISQSSIGNVGLAGHMGFVDLVMTPTVGTGWLITEEAMDRYVVRHFETKGFTAKVLSRMFLNPMRTIANLLRFKQPWYRDRKYGD